MIGALLSAILLAVAGLHLLWAIGLWWPIRDEAALAQTVVGSPGVTRMPGAFVTSLVVVALLGAAWWPWYGGFAGPRVHQLGLGALAAVFGARGLASFTIIPRSGAEPAFKRADKRYFGPLCLLIAALFLTILLRGHT